MTTLSDEQILRIAHLARLELATDTLADHAKNLTNILNFVEQINTIDIGDIEPMAHPQDQAQRLRSDEVTETIDRELFQANASLVENGLYLVPKVMDSAVKPRNDGGR